MRHAPCIVFSIVMFVFGLFSGLKSCDRFRFPNSLPSLAQCMPLGGAMRGHCRQLSDCVIAPYRYAMRLVMCRYCKGRKLVKLALPLCISVSLSFVVVLLLCVALATRGQSHIGKRLPTKNNNNLKLFLSNFIDSLRNPLFSSASRNPQAKGKLHGQENIWKPRKANQPLGSQAITPLVIPFGR